MDTYCMQISRLVKNGAYIISNHSYDRMRERGITINEIETVLTDKSLQLIETQSPSSTPGKEHADERYLVSSPHCGDLVIVCSIVWGNGLINVEIITAFFAMDSIWDKNSGNDPWLIRK